MIETIEGLPAGTVGFRLHGRVQGDDYDQVLVPELEKAIAEYDRIKALICFDADFEGYDLAAAWDDTLLGLRHWQGFARIAVVSDVAWLRTAIRAIGVLMPCPVQLFAADQEEQARRWLGESLGSLHLEAEGEVVRARLIGQLEPSAYEAREAEIASLFNRHAPLKLLVDLREFDGWSGLAALGDHLSLVREHRRALSRVAVVGNREWQHLAQRLIRRLLPAECRFFDAAHHEQAELWIHAA